MSGGLHRLHRARDEARRRVDNCRSELRRFEGYADPAREHDISLLCRLQRDLRLAETDAAHAALQLEDALHEEGLDL